MRNLFSRILGISLVVAAVLGLAVAVIGITGVWKFQSQAVVSLQNTLDFLDSTLQTTAGGLDIASTALEQANSSLNTLEATVETTGKSVQDLAPMLDALTSITTISLPETILSTQQALNAAQTSAGIIDSTLQFISSIPFLGIKQPATKAPLGEALGNVSDSLDEVPGTLRSMDQSLAEARANLNTIEGYFNAISGDIHQIGESLESAQEVTAQYQQMVSDLQEKVRQTREDLPITLALAALVLTFLFIWLGLTQLGLLVQGLDMLGIKILTEKPEMSESPRRRRLK